MSEGCGVTARGHQRPGGKGSNTRHLLSLATALSALVPTGELLLQLGHVTIPLFDVSQQPSKKIAHGRYQAVLVIAHDRRHGAEQYGNALRHHHPTCGEQTPELMGLRRARFDKALPGS